MVTTPLEFEDLLLTWLGEVSDYEIILGNDDLDYVPKNPYVIFKIDEVEFLMNPPEKLSDDGLVSEISNRCLISTTIESIGTSSSSSLFNISRILSSLRGAFCPLYPHIGLSGTTGVVDLTSVEVGSMRYRYRVSVDFYANIKQTFATYFYNKLDIVVKEENKGYEKVIKVPKEAC